MAHRSAMWNQKTGQMVYVHNNGHSNLALLKDHYDTPDAAEALFERAKASDASVLKPTIAECSWYDMWTDGVDRPRLFQTPRHDRTGALTDAREMDCEFLYTWTGDAWEGVEL